MSSRNRYKATFILDTRNYDQPVTTLIDKLKTVIESVSGVIKNVENLGQKEFARVTEKRFPAGVYVKFDFEALPTAPAAIKEKLKLDRNVNRVMVEAL